MRKLSELYDGVLLGNEDLTSVVTAEMMREEIESGKSYTEKYFTLRLDESDKGFTIVEEIEIDVMQDEMMIQIFGDDLRSAFEDNGIAAELKYKTSRELDRYEHVYEVWELTDKNLRKLDAIPDDVWSERNYGWYRYGERSQYPDGAVHIVNGHEMIGYSLEEDHLEIFQEDEKGHAIFKHALEYIYRGEGLSTEKNIAITCITLSMANNMTLAEFMTKYY